MSTTTPASGDVWTTLNYTSDTGKRQFLDLTKPYGTAGSASEETVPIKVQVRDARRTLTEGSLQTHGFEVFHCPTSLSETDFYKHPEKIEKENYAEISALICASIGAAECRPFHHMIRAADPKKQRAGKQVIEQPAAAIHADYTARDAFEHFRNLGPEGMSSGRFVIVNAWRNISDSGPILNDHLAMCDSTSTIAPDDFVHFDVINGDGNFSENYRLDAGNRERHRWYYYPRMVKDEVLLFMQFDSDQQSKVRYTFHTAMKDPSGPVDYFRQSLEMRCIAFFPTWANTIPMSAKRTRAERAAQAILSSLDLASQWDMASKMWMKWCVGRGSDGIKEAIEGMVSYEVKSDSVGSGLKEASQALQSEVIAILQQSDFEERARRNFQKQKGGAGWLSGW